MKKFIARLDYYVRPVAGRPLVFWFVRTWAIKLSRRVYPAFQPEPPQPNRGMNNADWCAAVIAHHEWTRNQRRRELVESAGMALVGFAVAVAIVGRMVWDLSQQLPQ